MAQKTITSGKAPVTVGSTKLYTSTKTTYETDNNGVILPNTVKHELITYPNGSSTTGTVQATSTGNSNQWSYPASSTLTSEQKNSLKSGNLYTETQNQIQQSATKEKIAPSEISKLSSKSLNAAKVNPGNTGDTNNQNGTVEPSAEQNETFKKEAGTEKGNTRSEYTDIKYPENLAEKSQDCIRFSILEYIPSLSSAATSPTSTSGFESRARVVELKSGSPVIKGSKRLGTITLPIPAGINDTNTVSWQTDYLNELQKAAGNVASKFLTGGADAGVKAGGEVLDNTKSATDSGEMQTAVASIFTGLAVGNSNVGKRAFGVVQNNNTELLFDSPQLRTFSFSFFFSPRSEKEAKIVMAIIRFFKQAMSVKSSKTSLLLKTPRTFAISYVTPDGKGNLVQHPYLNKFKECALTSCSVDYTPDGNYMTYWSVNPDGRSMTSYRLTLSFSELEPVFDDEYGNESASQIQNVGY